MFNRRQFFNLYIDSFTKEEQIGSIPEGSHIVTLNMEQVVLAQKDEIFAQIIREAELIIADSAAIELTAKFIYGYRDIKKLAGIDLAQLLINRFSRIAILGARVEVIGILQKKLGHKLVFAHHGYFSEEEKDLTEKIISLQPELLLVALGSPRQEKFIYQSKKFLPKTISIGVGGSFDIWSGSLKRAPKWMISLHLEWLFRIFQEPNRIKRFLYNLNGYFLLLVSNFFDEG